MSSLAKSTVNCTNSIIISDVKIHMDSEGRYSLNDLHVASGKEEKHQPAFFMRRNETIELINEIFNSANMQNKNPVISKKGRYGGTYVCKELVYSYAMWISAAFALKVIRAYDAMVTATQERKTIGGKTSVAERTPLRDAVNMLVGKKGLRYDDAYNMVHQRFGIDSIDELSIEQIPLAVEYIHRVVLEGEFIGKQERKVNELSAKEANSLVWLWDYANRSQALFRELYPALKQIQSNYSGRCHDCGYEFSRIIDMARDVLINHTRDVDINEPDGPTNLSAWMRLKNKELPPSVHNY
ncbi:P22AR C-terminal domain-containing protein [Escherichia coli]